MDVFWRSLSGRPGGPGTVESSNDSLSGASKVQRLVDSIGRFSKSGTEGWQVHQGRRQKRQVRNKLGQRFSLSEKLEKKVLESVEYVAGVFTGLIVVKEM